MKIVSKTVVYKTFIPYCCCIKHFYDASPSGNLDCNDTLNELFGSRCVIPSMEIGIYFAVLVEKLGPHYSMESLLVNHTIYPYYASFLSKARQQEILQDVLKDG